MTHTAQSKGPGKDPIVEVHNLTVRLGGKEILRELDLEVREGEFVAIVGRSGSGKSTLLNALAGFIEKQGEIRIPGNFGFIFQNYAAFPWLTVRKNILFGMPHDLSSSDKEARLKDLLETTDLTPDAGKYPAELSGGQVQRVAFARALARRPAVLLMDEPFGALDMYTREKMQTWLLDFCEREKQTVMFVTHSIEEAILLSDRVIVLAQEPLQNPPPAPGTSDRTAEGSRGARITKVFDVPFPRPRAKSLQYEADFIALKKEIAIILEATQP